ncbi:MAG: NUDIX domain-containing protein [Candidatus Taylorbacteria bacterium]|nr:NUDIX domain-containing protein [Candidatus Taylorbacteria bacterium]
MSEPDKNLRPKVGLGVMIMKDSKVLMGKRKGSHGEGKYCFPGGHLEYMESIMESIAREVSEEVGIEIKNIRFLRLYNEKEYAPKHYVNIGFVADWKSGEPKVLEPDKCESWGWYEIDNLPSPLYSVIPSLIESYKTGKNFYDN